jgi:hypothetical protein
VLIELLKEKVSYGFTVCFEDLWSFVNLIMFGLVIGFCFYLV